MEPEEPDWEGIWRRIVADAEQHVEAWKRQARWFEEGNALPSPDEWYAAQRRASKAFVRHTIQQLDLADAINRGDLASYIQRWYPLATPPNGPSISITTYDEASALFERTLVHVEEIAASGGFTLYQWSAYDAAAKGQPDGHPSALDKGVRGVGRAYQAGKATALAVPRWLHRHRLLEVGRLRSLLDKARRR